MLPSLPACHRIPILPWRGQERGEEGRSQCASPVVMLAMPNSMGPFPRGKGAPSKQSISPLQALASQRQIQNRGARRCLDPEGRAALEGVPHRKHQTTWVVKKRTGAKSSRMAHETNRDGAGGGRRSTSGTVDETAKTETSCSVSQNAVFLLFFGQKIEAKKKKKR